MNKLNTSKLSPGMVIKNYKELCTLLNVPIKTGGSKKLQDEEFKRYFNYKKSGYKYIITEIYNTPVPKKIDMRINNRGGNNRIYIDLIEYILSDFLSNQRGNTCNYTLNQWYYILGMVNENYKKIDSKELLELDPIITNWEITQFYHRTNTKFNKIFLSALKSLSDRKLIKYNKNTCIAINEQQPDGSYKTIYKKATNAQERQLLKIEKKALDEMGYDKVSTIYLKGLTHEYNELITEYLEEKGWLFYFRQVEIMYLKNEIKEDLPKMEYNLKLSLNNKIVNYFNTKNQKDYNKNIEKYNEYEEKFLYEDGDNLPFKYPEQFIYAQELLIDKLVKVDNGEILEDEFEEFLENII